MKHTGGDPIYRPNGAMVSKGWAITAALRVMLYLRQNSSGGSRGQVPLKYGDHNTRCGIIKT